MKKSEYKFTTKLKYVAGHDMISVQLTPNELERYLKIMVKKAEDCDTYDAQGHYRETVDRLRKTLDGYNRARKIFDAKKKKGKK